MKTFSIRLKRADLMLVLAVLIIAGILFAVQSRFFTAASTDNHSYAIITINNEIYKKIKLTAEAQIVEVRTDHGYDILKIHDYGIEVVESDCPDKVCFTFGFIRRPHQTIICLPLRMRIEIQAEPAEPQSDIDAWVS